MAIFYGGLTVCDREICDFVMMTLTVKEHVWNNISAFCQHTVVWKLKDDSMGRWEEGVRMEEPIYSGQMGHTSTYKGTKRPEDRSVTRLWQKVPRRWSAIGQGGWLIKKAVTLPSLAKVRDSKPPSRKHIHQYKPLSIIVIMYKCFLLCFAYPSCSVPQKTFEV